MYISTFLQIFLTVFKLDGSKSSGENEIPKVFAKEAIRIADANGVEVIDKAQTPVNPVSPNKKMNILIAGVLGVMIGLFIIFIIEFLNTKIKTPQDIEKELGLPLLGVIPEEL